MYEPKMKEHDGDVIEFIESVENPKKRQDAYRLLEIFEELSGHPPKMWGPSIIGFGSYHYIYASGHEGNAPLVGFSPRKAKISLYIGTSEGENEPLLNELGKHTSGKSCVYVNKLDDINEDVLKKIIAKSIADIQELYPA
ncbi:DUF1801 domain-containing protein [Planococcus sp. CAU13]|uniref:DUF1801 domain-containing protein n=1 Tax=Planococcus sp. CAU13 TaxID=1541197 RepID=UPI00053007AE|nr:DUF1801 domain-containing protein [Planococcus sp. CAU13]